MPADEPISGVHVESVVLPAEEIEPVGDASAFYRFERQIIELDRELRELSNAARQLGSSVGILSACFRLCERLGRILFLFRENAAALFPNKVRRQGRELQVDRYWNFKRGQRRFKRNRLLSMVAQLSTSQDQPKPEELPNELEDLARDMATLLDCFGQYPEFVDEVPEQSLEDDLKSWADYLRQFIDEIESLAFRRYTHDLSVKMGKRLQRISNFIPSFIKVGIPTIRGAQKHSAGNLLNLSTVATLFSGVTATMIQFSFESNSNVIEDAVNGFWFTSLVFSISAAVNSLLGLSWMQAAFRSPDHRVPWWVLMWVKRSPLVFLVLSVACFFIGLVLFAYASEQNRIVATLTAVLSAACCCGLAAFSIWFVFERLGWIQDWHIGTKLLSDLFHNIRENFLDLRFVAWSLSRLRTMVRWNKQLLMKGAPAWRLVKRGVSRTFFSSSRRAEALATDLGAERPAYAMGPPTSPPDLEAQEILDGTLTRPQVGGRRGTLTGRDRFVAIVRRVIAMQQGNISRKRPIRTAPRISRRQISGVSDFSTTLPIATKEILLPKLQELSVVKQLDMHIALVRDLQFSPDGRLLATTSWDQQTKIFDVKDNFSLQHTLPHTSGWVSQLEWSPCGKMLLIKSNIVIRLWIWTEHRVTKRPFVRDCPVESIKWLPNSEAFLSVEDDVVVKLDLHGNVLRRYSFEGKDLGDVVATRDLKWILCVATVLPESAPESPPEEDVGKNQIILYSLQTCTIAKQVPIFFAAPDISLAADDQSVLVSFENKAAPQLWKLNTENEKEPQLVLRHTYPSPGKPDWAVLPSIFGGETDNLVLRAETGGSVHIWDRETATLLHVVRGPSGIGHASSLAWNASTSTLMFATGSHDGAVNIWSVNSASGRDSVGPSRGYRTPTMDLTHSPTSMASSYRRVASPSSFNIGYRSESPTLQLAEDDEHPEIFESQLSPPRIRRSTTFS